MSTISNSVNFGDLVPSTDYVQACDFLFELHKYSPGYLVISQIIDTPHSVRSFAGSLGEICKTFVNRMEDLVADGRQVYVGCSTHSIDPCDGGRLRGGENTVLAVPGVWADLDLKSGSFSSTEEIRDFVRALAVQPTMVVDSGSGGVHCYWLFDHAPVDAEAGHRLNEMWWAYLQEQAGERAIDRVYPVDRILRVPGTIRWPKRKVNETITSPRAVRLVVKDGPRHQWWRINEIALPAWERLQDQRARDRAQFDLQDFQLARELDALANDPDNPWAYALSLPIVHWDFNESVTWDEILEPAGWTKTTDYSGVQKVDRSGRRQWSRPGSDEKSATTDWHDGPHTMVLHSSARETGLLTLKDAGVKLTKLRVYAELHHNGDVAAAVRAFRARKEA